MNEEKIRKILVLIDLERRSFLLAKKISFAYFLDEVDIVFYSVKRNIFFKKEKKIDDILEYALNYDLIFNLLPVDLNISRRIERDFEKMDLNLVGNNLETRLLFFSKNNLKKFFKNYDIKSPVYSLIGNQTAEELFKNFPQPSRIFSKSNNYFSGKIETSEEMEKRLEELDKNERGNYLIEEYIEGESYYVFSIKKESIISKIFLKEIDNKLKKEIERNIENIFKIMNIDKFALFHFKVNKFGFIFVLNIFVEFDILLGNKGEIMDKVFEKEDISLKDFLDNLHKK